MFWSWLKECVFRGYKCPACGERFTLKQWKEARADMSKWDGGHVVCPVDPDKAA